MYLLTLWAFLQTEMTDFPTRSYTSTGEIPALSYSFLQSLSVYVSGGSRGWEGGGGRAFPLLLDETEARRAAKCLGRPGSPFISGSG